MHGKDPGYIPLEHWVVCDVCGFEYRESEMRESWDHKVVCQKDYEPRHPQDFVRARVEDTSAKGAIRPEPADTYNADTPVYDRTANHHTVPTGTF